MPTPDSPRLKAVKRELRNFTHSIHSSWYAEEYYDGEMILIGLRELQYDADDRGHRPWKQGYQLVFNMDWIVGPRAGVKIANLKHACNIVARSSALHEVDEWLRYKGVPLHEPHFGDHSPYVRTK